MKKSTLPVLLLLISLISYGQNVKQLLQHSYSKCRNIKSGYYEMEKKMKFMSLKDTTLDLQFKFYFKKLKNDSLYTVAFNSEMLHQGDYIRNDLYTGNEYITFCKMDSSAKIMSKAKWAKTIKERSRNDIFNYLLYRIVSYHTVSLSIIPYQILQFDNLNSRLYKVVTKLTTRKSILKADITILKADDTFLSACNETKSR